MPFLSSDGSPPILPQQTEQQAPPVPEVAKRYSRGGLMSAFLVLLGCAAWFSALSDTLDAKSAIHQILAAIWFLVGVVEFGFAALLIWLSRLGKEAAERSRAMERMARAVERMERAGSISPV